MNNNQVSDSDNELHDVIKVSCEEQPYDGGGWAGDGSGQDDFEDYNQNEANDYYNE